MAKKITSNTNETLCRNCEHHYEPDYSNLGATGEPILCKCRKRKFMVFYNIIEKCNESKPIKNKK